MQCKSNDWFLYQERHCTEYWAKAVLLWRGQIPTFPLYRNQSTDLLCKLFDWFLHDGSIGLLVNGLKKFLQAWFIISIDYLLKAILRMEMFYKVKVILFNQRL